MTVHDKIQTIDSKIEHNKALCGLDRQVALISPFSLANVGKHEFMTGKDVLLEKGLVEKAATMKRFESSPLGSELIKQTSIAEKQYQRFDDCGEALTIKKDDKALPIKKHNRSNFSYNPDFTVYKFRDVIFWMKIFTSEWVFKLFKGIT